MFWNVLSITKTKSYYKMFSVAKFYLVFGSASPLQDVAMIMNQEGGNYLNIKVLYKKEDLIINNIINIIG